MTRPRHSPKKVPPPPLSHVSRDGTARMVDVGAKPVTARTAIAEGFVRISRSLHARIRDDTIRKGSVLGVARVAGIQGAKRTSELIPLCHALALDAIEVTAELEPEHVRVTAKVRTQARTGVEMEALTAVAVACLTVIDMGKSVDKGMRITSIRVLEKHGGRSGSYLAPRTTGVSA